VKRSNGKRLLETGLLSIALLLMAALCITAPVAAQSFPSAPNDDVTPSIAKAIIWVEPAFANLVSGTQGWSSGTWTSPYLFDSTTTIGHSKVHIDGSTTDSSGAVVGTAGSIVADNNFSIHPFEGPNGMREIHTEIYKLDLKAPAACNNTIRFRIRGGRGMGVSFPSYGEVEASQASSDFPATSFFQVYVELDTSFGVLQNIDPLMISNPAINGLPPSVVYIHGLTPAVNIFFKGGPYNGQRFGVLRLAGHELIPGGQERCPDPCGYCPAKDDLDQALEDSELMQCPKADDCYAYEVNPDGGTGIDPKPINP